MAIQTGQLCESLPNFAGHFRAADAKGSSDWEVIQWETTHPSAVTPERVARPDELIDSEQTRVNRFGSRTEALRYSRLHVLRLHPDASESGHRGVWSWVQNGTARYQSIAPVPRYAQPSEHGDAPEQSDPGRRLPGPADRKLDAPMVVRETRRSSYSPMVRVSPETNRRLREIAAQDQTTLQAVIDSAIKQYYRAWMFQRADAAYDALRQDSDAWAQELAERNAWDATLLDGIEPDEVWQGGESVEANSPRVRTHG